MSGTAARKDLIVLVADQDMKATLEGLLVRTESLGIRPITFEVLPHPRHDAGCRTQSAEFLRPFTNRFIQCLVLFDHEGCGEEQSAATELEDSVNERLAKSGWGARSNVIVLEPELEVWIWSDSSAVDQCCGWTGQSLPLREWIAEQFPFQDNGKPIRPKEAFRAILRQTGKIPSSSLFRELATKVGLKRCQDRAFLRLKATLADWFPTK